MPAVVILSRCACSVPLLSQQHVEPAVQLLVPADGAGWSTASTQAVQEGRPQHSAAQTAVALGGGGVGSKWLARF